MTIGKLIGMGAASLALAAVPAGIDTRALIVDQTGTAMGTAGNPLVTSVGAGSGTQAVQGTLTNNGAAPGATNVGVLPALANAALPAWTEGRQVLQSVNLDGVQRVMSGYANGGAIANENPMLIGGIHSDATKRIFGTATASDASATGVNLMGAGVLYWDSAAYRRGLSDTSGRGISVGAAATGAAVAGNPVLAGGSDGTNAQALKVDTSGRTMVVGGVAVGAATSGGNPVTIGAGDAANNVATLRAFATTDAVANSVPALFAGAEQLDFNGTSWDRHRNNVDVTLLGVASRTTTQTSADIVTYNAHSIIVTLDVTTVGTGSLTLTINYKDPASSKYILLLSGAAVTTNSTNVYTVNPNIPAVANVSAQKDLGRIIQIVVTANNANAVIYSTGYTLVS